MIRASSEKTPPPQIHDYDNEKRRPTFSRSNSSRSLLGSSRSLLGGSSPSNLVGSSRSLLGGSSRSKLAGSSRSQLSMLKEDSFDMELNPVEAPEHGRKNSRRGCVLRFESLTKSVVVKDESKGLLGSSISSRRSSENKDGDQTPKFHETKDILQSVGGSAAPGEVMALMGPSGSGKTTLLSVLSGRASYDSGTFSIDGVEVTNASMKKFRRRIAYVMQSDVFFEYLTVRDQLTYTALLRLPSSWSNAEKHAEVDRLIQLLHLEKCADSAIMMISGGEKKRLNIGTEMLTDPAVIMLDEPTSGLDSTNAVALIRVLLGLARNEGKTIITSIHQPSSAVFRSFDRLLLLADGHVVYFGTPRDSIPYLESRDFECPRGYNAADHWMDLLVNDQTNILSSESQSSTSKERLIAVWDEETSGAALRRFDSVNDEKAEQFSRIGRAASISNGPTNIENSEKKYNVGWWAQFRVLTHRSLKNGKSAIFTPLTMMRSALVGLVAGLLWFQTKKSEIAVKDRSAYIFFTMTYWAFDGMFEALMAFPSERKVIFKERASGSYHLSAYFLAKTTSEAPTRLVLPIFYMVISYWLAAINPRFLIFLGTTSCTLLCVLAGESIGLVIGACLMDEEKAMTALIVVSLLLMVVGGYYVENIPVFISWMEYLSPFKYSFDGAQQLIFDRDVSCDGSSIMEVCGGRNYGVATRQEVLDHLNIEGSLGFSFGMLIVVSLVPRYVAYLFLRAKKGAERS